MTSAPSVVMPDLLDSGVRRNGGGVFYINRGLTAYKVILLPHSGRPQEVPSKEADDRRGFDLPLCDAPSIAEAGE